MKTHTSIEPVTLTNWHRNESFVHFLQFEFDLHSSPAKVKREVLTLLPLAVGDQRMYGSIAGTVLREAIRMWNQPLLWHVFTLDELSKRWRYVGGFIARPYEQRFPHFFGRLRHPIKPGSFCKKPAAELMLAKEA